MIFTALRLFEGQDHLVFDTIQKWLTYYSLNTLLTIILANSIVKNIMKLRTYSPCAQEAVKLLGQLIQLERKQRRWSEKELAGRAGIARATLQRIEKGEMTPKIGIVFEVASLMGVTLFANDKTPLSNNIAHMNDKIALLPKRIRKNNSAIDDDF